MTALSCHLLRQRFERSFDALNFSKKPIGSPVRLVAIFHLATDFGGEGGKFLLHFLAGLGQRVFGLAAFAIAPRFPARPNRDPEAVPD